MNWKIFLMALVLIFSNLVMAGQVRVSQDNEGDGNFIVQGFVEVFDQTAFSAAALYKYGNPCGVSYSGTVFTPSLDTTTLAVIDTSEGRTVFVVHDIPALPFTAGCPYQGQDITGGTSDNTYTLSFDTGMECMVRDDDPGNDDYDTCGGSFMSVDVDHLWVPSRTDGIVLGTLEGAWRLDMSYNSDPTGINSVLVKGGDGFNVSGLIPPNTIRLDNVIEVGIDIKPGSDPNCFNINDHGVVPVAILGSEVFDVSLVEPSTLDFAGLVVRVRGNNNPQCSIKDSNGDGFDDLVCQFVDDASAWTAGDSTAQLSGELDDTTPFVGEDAICVRP